MKMEIEPYFVICVFCTMASINFQCFVIASIYQGFEKASFGFPFPSYFVTYVYSTSVRNDKKDSNDILFLQLWVATWYSSADYYYLLIIYAT